MAEKEEVTALKENKDENQSKPFVWRPMPSIFSTALCFGILGLIMVILGIVLLTNSASVNEQLVRYDNTDCNITCSKQIVLSTDFEPPIMVYYQLENYYQNHRRYIRSKSLSQLSGKSFDPNITSPLDWSTFDSECSPITTVQQLGISRTVSGRILEPYKAANPCGLIAKSVFNDTYQLVNSTHNIFINETDIAWPEDKKYRFIKPPNWQHEQWIDINDEHFMVWMRPAAIPTFRKLWGRINTRLSKGTYDLKFENNYPVASFNGKKSFVLSTCNAFGGKNNFLGIAYICVGIVCLIFAILFWVGYKDYHKDKTE